MTSRNSMGATRRVVAKSKRAADGFSLIELLVVIGLIVALVGGGAFALRDAGGSGLGPAQKILAGVVSAARAQAAVAQTETILAIYGARPPIGDKERFLRLLQVFKNDNPGGTPVWVPAGNPVTLPYGVYVVPTTTSGMVAGGIVWPTNPPVVSTLRGPINLGQQAGTPFGAPATAYVVEFSPDGTITQVGTQTHARLVVATAVLTNNGPQFNNDKAVRGLLLRPTGGITFVNEFTGF